MGLPILGDVAFLLWNREALRAAGLPDGAPASWDEVVARGRKLTGGGHFGFALPAGKTPQCAVLWTMLFHAFGGTYFDAAGAPTLGRPGRGADHALPGRGSWKRSARPATSPGTTTR